MRTGQPGGDPINEDIRMSGGRSRWPRCATDSGTRPRRASRTSRSARCPCSSTPTTCSVLPRRDDRTTTRPVADFEAVLARPDERESDVAFGHGESAAALADIRVARLGTETSWSRGGRVFACWTKTGAELRLDVPIAAAAMNTPATAASTRGSEWSGSCRRRSTVTPSIG